MTINYTEMIRLVRVRQMQIKDVALEQERYNTEFNGLKTIEKELANLIVNERIIDEERIRNEN